MEFRDYYKTLGIERSASADDIRKAYRRLARKYHPDVSKEADALERFKQMQEAYEVLKDPKKRAAYDELGANWKQGEQFRPPPDFGTGFDFNQARRGRDQHAGIELDLEEAHRGTVRNLPLQQFFVNGPATTERTLRVTVPAGV